ncbi:hypothetical protein HNQ91_000128 [Filimonas zeae]|uniref:DUF1349 domain-containing protein n=1 Tax=Filimonas zeae TaxID=1737353 RepID=A0A917ILF2_9BACT|nr:DUF1349 domain-containing protein [Filimonas zeae]MDR6337106.1 hypothetical protein [Filimonas zeae]GGH57029.1 hypothetical protein GCM10011379_01260 [Filimonas zeae]
MKIKLSSSWPLLLAAAITSCGSEQPQNAPATAAETHTSGDSARVSGKDCNITIAGIPFTRSVNGADSMITVNGDKVSFRAGEKKDFFCDPNNQLSNNTAPMLLTKVDNTKPFTLIAKVTPEFTQKGLYNAGVLYIYVHDNFWQKFCFEQDERGNHRMVTVRTIGTSDDNNHDIVTQPTAYMKLSSDTRTVASYYSFDKKTWHMVRLYQNNYPKEIWMGISNQCPVDTGSVSHFEEISLQQNNVADFRMGN